MVTTGEEYLTGSNIWGACEFGMFRLTEELIGEVEERSCEEEEVCRIEKFADWVDDD